ncbi:beta-ketoacyl-ACP synthase III [Gorillibacterium sp. sgz5001074]|uniref:beta-ketoacyl-ACP synthase III n=1 Tax=Gorillibacterium sp. sgz5001074 TaxID=3446695 RepID=UPI003F66258D
MHKRWVKIEGLGKYLPRLPVTSREMDARLGVAEGWVKKTTDVDTRYFVQGETSSFMGAEAAWEALRVAGLTFADIDCLICTSAVGEQPLPSSAVLIQKAMGQEKSGIPAYDINATCLGFMAGLDTMSYLVDAGRYRRVLLVSSEIPSAGLNWRHKESAALFGDGAAAAVISRSEDTGAPERSAILASAIRTYSEGLHYSQIRGGGTRMHPREHSAETEECFLFEMDGHGIFRMASKLLPDFVDELLRQADCSMKELKLVIPHQGSAMAMRLICKKLGISSEQLMYITPNHGNTVSASLPMGLYEAVRQGRLKRGDKFMLLGTAAGLSLGGMVLEY